MKNTNYISFILVFLLFSFNLSFSQDSIRNNVNKELLELLDNARDNGASADQLKEIIKTFKSNKFNIANELKKELILDEIKRAELDDIVIKMLSNNESDEKIQWVVNDFKKKYGKPINQKKKYSISEFASIIKSKYPEYKNTIKVKEEDKTFFTPLLIEQLSNIGAIIIIPIVLYFIYKKRKLIIEKLNKFTNSSVSTYILELVFPIILTSLFYLLLETKRMSVDRDTIAGLVSFLFFFILVLEWIRRKKDKTERAYYFKYLYIGLMLLVFVLGVWYANELVVDYQAPKRTKSIFAF